jgi:NAD(P)-dependent dehydrogenase (short-subunit alcohol dehydrogenase family)
VLDLSTTDAAQDLVDAVVSEHGRLDALFCNHAISEADPFLESSTERLDRMIAVNVSSAYVLNQHCARAMATASGGSIINMASSSALKPMPTLCGYAMTKSAIIAMTRVMAAELAEHGIRVNAICPGIIDTPMPRRAVETLPPHARDVAIEAMAAAHPLKRLGTPSEIAWLAIHLASDESSFTTGAIIPADGGISVS